MYGYTGKEIALKLGNAEFVPQNETADYQISINVNYSVSDPTLVGKEINAVMKVHSPDGSVIKTTSFPLGFTANSTWDCRIVDEHSEIRSTEYYN